MDDPRRRILVQALSLGFFVTGSAFAQKVLGDRPGKLPPDKSVYRVTGKATVNGAEATESTRIKPGDTVRTEGRSSEIIFVVGTHGMLLRGGSELRIEGDEPSLLVRALRLVSGALLQVSRNRPMTVISNTASIGIRGTGFYVEAEPEQTYFCTCYGQTEIAAIADPQAKTRVDATHHDRPLYIVSKAERGKHVRNAPFINHTDQELALIEALVGREPPFVFPKDAYGAPRRSY